MLDKIIYLIAKGDAVNAGEWARKIASEAFHNNYSLRVYSFDNVKCTVTNTRFEAYATNP